MKTYKELNNELECLKIEHEIVSNINRQLVQEIRNLRGKHDTAKYFQPVNDDFFYKDAYQTTPNSYTSLGEPYNANKLQN